MFKVAISMLKALLNFFKYPFYFCISMFLLFLFLCLIFTVIGLFHGKRFKKGSRQKVKKHGFFRKIFIDLPKRFVNDRFERDPDFFQYQGLIIYEGRQGSGKTTSMIYDTMNMQKEYPLAKCITNLAYKNEDTSLKDWRMLINYKNGIKGVIVCMDELQNWFSSADSKSFPPEMLQVITQNRKNRRVIMGTAQNFYLLSKAIRTQTTEIRRCNTLLGCLTFVRRFEPILDSQGEVVEFKKRGFYFFVHTDELRNAFDTFKVIERLTKVGFNENVSETNVVTNTYIVEPKKKTATRSKWGRRW